MLPRISVIIPTFNAADTLERCLSSLARQTVPLHEIIVVDDGSTDDSATVAENLAKLYPQIQVLRQSNTGVSGARNRGLDNSTGDFVGFVDPDDYVDPTMYARLLEGALENSAAMVVLGEQTIRPHADTRDNTTVIQSDIAARRLLLLEYPSSVWAHIYSSEAIRDLRFNQDIGLFEDLLYNFEALRRVDRVVAIPGTLYYYQPGPGGANLAPLSEAHLSALAVCELIRARAGSQHLSHELAFLEAHCIGIIIYKASLATAIRPDVAQRLKSFARDSRSECLASPELHFLYKLMVFAVAASPSLVIAVARLGIRGKRALKKTCDTFR